MSAESIARWNAIPLTHPDADNDVHTLKRSRPGANAGDDDESEDDVSLVSHSPSPAPPDPTDVDKYDEYVKGTTEHEVVTVNTRIKSSNKGFLMLAKMGWVEGHAIGLSGEGRVDPVPFYVKNDLTGLGKTNQDVRMIESTVAQRRDLDSERQTKETEEQRRAREDSVTKRAAVQSEISTSLRAFYCQLCDKQFQNVAQYDEHTNSYAHHHKARFRDMQAAQRANRNTKEEVDKRKEKERKREEKELRKIAKAAGVKMAKPSMAQVAVSVDSVAVDDEKPSGFKKSGWASMSSSSEPSEASATVVSSGFKKAGWTAVDTSVPNRRGPTNTEEAVRNVSSSSTLPMPSISSSAETTVTGHRPTTGHTPAFRTGGWTSLDTGSSMSVPPPPQAAQYAPPLLSPPPANLPPLPSSSALSRPPPTTDPPPPFPPPSTPPTRPGWSAVSTTPSIAEQPSRSWQSVSASGFASPSPSFSPPVTNMPSRPPPPSPGASRSRPTSGSARQESARSGWQQFRAGAPGRRR